MTWLFNHKPFWKNVLLTIAIMVCFQSYSFAADVTLQWDANTESNLKGYKLYYGSFSGAPYDGKGVDQGDSPITIDTNDLKDPLNPEFALTGLDIKEYYFITITAYDSEGIESDFSNEVSLGPEGSSFGGSFANENDINMLSNHSADSGCFVKTATSCSK